MEFSVISEKFQKFQINNTIRIQSIRSLGIDIKEFSVISEKFQINNTNYPKPRYRYRGIFSNFREISEISNKQYKLSEA